MTKILDKWYMSMFIIPIILTYLTEYFELPLIFNNWKNSIIASLIILNGLLIYEYKTLINNFRELKNKPKESDKKIVVHLLKTLDLDKFHEDIYEQDSWYGYPKEAISCIIDFTHESRLIKNKVSNDKVNKLLFNLVVKLNYFKEYSSVRLFGENNYFVPNKDNQENLDKIRLETIQMNKMAKESFLELEKLTDYLKDKEYI